jgi:hypothetical protein
MINPIIFIRTRNEWRPPPRLGRFVSPDWLSREALENYAITWGMVQEFEEQEKQLVEEQQEATAAQLQRAAGL